ncbi:hypothetical protein RB195_013060 [Necator americanus]|uniref:Roadblock/LAMTOR2 domain-containing protein n=1 Tax=Necator americanus TaxID=51031 RepID=A0ABR1DV07_NECAM
MLRQKALVEVLGQANTAEVSGALLFNREGLLLAYSGYGDSKDHANVSAALISNIWESFDKKGGREDLKEATIICDDGVMAATRVANMLLALKASKNCHCVTKCLEAVSKPHACRVRSNGIDPTQRYPFPNTILPWRQVSTSSSSLLLWNAAFNSACKKSYLYDVIGRNQNVCTLIFCDSRYLLTEFSRKNHATRGLNETNAVTTNGKLSRPPPIQFCGDRNVQNVFEMKTREHPDNYKKMKIA